MTAAEAFAEQVSLRAFTHAGCAQQDDAPRFVRRRARRHEAKMVAALEPRGAVGLAHGFNSSDFWGKPVAIHGRILSAIFPAPSICTWFTKIGLAFAKIGMLRTFLL